MEACEQMRSNHVDLKMYSILLMVVVVVFLLSLGGAHDKEHLMEGHRGS